MPPKISSKLVERNPELHQIPGVNVAPVPMLPFFTFVVASVVSLVLGHVATVFHRRTQRCEREAAVQRTVSQEIREARDGMGWDVGKPLKSGKIIESP